MSKPKTGETFEQFEKRFWEENPNYGNPELRANGQFDDIPYYLWEEDNNELKLVRRAKALNSISYTNPEKLFQILHAVLGEIPADATDIRFELSTEYDSPVAEFTYYSPENELEKSRRIENEKRQAEYRYKHYEELKKEFESRGLGKWIPKEK